MESRTWIVAFVHAIALLATAATAAGDPLPSWAEGAAKQRILAFVAEVTKTGDAKYVAPEDRVAVFDNDGCLWVERPTYPQVFFVLDRLDELAPQHPEWKTTQPYRAALERDMDTLGQLGVPALLELVVATHTGMEQPEFEAEAERFLATVKHPRWKRRFPELVYQPQLELLEYLRENDFRVFIVSGGGRDFVRVFSESTYGVPRNMVIGSAVQKHFEVRGGRPTLVRLGALVEPIDDKAGKPVHIDLGIGRVPIMAVGNSDGDLQMLQYSTTNGDRSLQVLIHHDDAEREYAYDHGAEKALAAAAEHGWLVVSMERDFQRIFPHDDGVTAKDSD